MEEGFERWSGYQRVVEGRIALVSFDDAISSRIDDAPRHLLSVILRFANPLPVGLPNREEHAATDAFEADLEPLLDEHACVMVGRVFCGGYCVFYVYTDDGESEIWSERLSALAAPEPLELQFTLEPDPEHAAYWESLYPTEVEREQMRNFPTWAALQDRGNDDTIARTIDHFAYFPDDASATRFRDAATSMGFAFVEARGFEDGRTGIQLTHFGNSTIPSISDRTTKLRALAAECGGEYDGWGCAAMPKPAQD